MRISRGRKYFSCFIRHQIDSQQSNFADRNKTSFSIAWFPNTAFQRISPLEKIWCLITTQSNAKARLAQCWNIHIANSSSFLEFPPKLAKEIGTKVEAFTHIYRFESHQCCVFPHAPPGFNNNTFKGSSIPIFLLVILNSLTFLPPRNPLVFDSTRRFILLLTQLECKHSKRVYFHVLRVRMQFLSPGFLQLCLLCVLFYLLKLRVVYSTCALLAEQPC